MNCPRCQTPLIKLESEGVELDLCAQGCGGIWFDWLELKKFDETHEADQDLLDQLGASASLKVDHQKPMNCPKCPNIVMMKHFFSVKREVEVDECASCGGFWLDAQELTHIHELYPTEAERKKAAEEYFKEEFGPQLEKMRNESEEKMRTAKKIGHMLRFISPRYYIEGKFSKQ